MTAIDTSLLVPGVVVCYHLLPSQLPKHPEREWRGRLLSVHIGMPNSLDVGLVECLDEGYDLAIEFVLLSQITRQAGTVGL